MWILIKTNWSQSCRYMARKRVEATLAFRDALETMNGRVDDGIMICVAGDFNAHVWS